MTVKTINGKAVNATNEMAIEMDQWLENCGLEQNEIASIHMNDTFPARTSMMHYFTLVVSKLNAPLWRKSLANMVSNIQSDNDISEFLGKFYNGEDDVYKFIGVVDRFNDYKVRQRFAI